MTNTTMKVDGAVLMWSLAEFSYLKAMQDGLECSGWKKHRPHPRTLPAVLKDALMEVCGGNRVLIRPLKSEGGTEGFVVKTEKRDTDDNDYETELVAKVGPNALIKLKPFDDRAAAIVAAFNKQLGLIRAPAVTNAIVDVLKSLGGTCLRPHGGVYWLHGSEIERWKELVAIVENCGVGKNAMYIVRHDLDDDAARAITDSITAEVEAEVKLIAEAIMDGDLGKRALDSKQRQASALAAKIKRYEDILQTGLGKLLETVDKAETAIAQATIIGSGTEAA